MSSDRGSSSGNSSGSGNSTADRNRVTPRPQREAPAGASLGHTSTGATLVSNGNGTGTINGPRATDDFGRSDGDVIPLSEMAPLTFPAPATSLSPTGTETPVVADLPAPTPIDTTVTPGASDVMTAIASNVGQAAPRPAAISNNFTSLASRAGSKRSLIGGA